MIKNIVAINMVFREAICGDGTGIPLAHFDKTPIVGQSYKLEGDRWLLTGASEECST